MKRTHSSCVSFPFGVALLVAACGDPLVDPQTVTGLRILGAKSMAVDDPSEAHIAPGAGGNLTWLVVAEREREYHALSVFCEAEPGTFDVPRCGAPFLEEKSEGTTGTPLSVGFELPEAFGERQAWLSFLALCEEGEPRWNKNTQRFSCTTDDQALVSVYHGMPNQDANHNPSLQDDTLRFDGEEWSESSEQASCDNESTPRLSRDAVARIQLTAKGTDSEELDDPSYAAAPQESLTYTHVTTTAGLSRAFSAIDPGAKEKTFELELSGDEAWAEAKATLTGAFYLVVSDGRGGADWLQRSYCLTK